MKMKSTEALLLTAPSAGVSGQFVTRPQLQFDHSLYVRASVLLYQLRIMLHLASCQSPDTHRKGEVSPQQEKNAPKSMSPYTL